MVALCSTFFDLVQALLHGFLHRSG